MGCGKDTATECESLQLLALDPCQLLAHLFLWHRVPFQVLAQNPSNGPAKSRVLIVADDEVLSRCIHDETDNAGEHLVHTTAVTVQILAEAYNQKTPC